MYRFVSMGKENGRWIQMGIEVNAVNGEHRWRHSQGKLKRKIGIGQGNVGGTWQYMKTMWE